jgi:hypothetical protein
MSKAASHNLSCAAHCTLRASTDRGEAPARAPGQALSLGSYGALGPVEVLTCMNDLVVISSTSAAFTVIPRGSPHVLAHAP